MQLHKHLKNAARDIQTQCHAIFPVGLKESNVNFEKPNQQKMFSSSQFIQAYKLLQFVILWSCVFGNCMNGRSLNQHQQKKRFKKEYILFS